MIERITKNWKSTIAAVIIFIIYLCYAYFKEVEIISFTIALVTMLSFLFATDTIFSKIWETLDKFINKR